MIRLLFYLVLIILNSCSVGPNFHSPPAPNTQQYTSSPLPRHTVSAQGRNGQRQVFKKGEDISASWWKIFHSKNLNRLIEQGLLNNPDMEAAQAVLREACENLSVEGGNALPSVNAGIFAQRQRISTLTSGVIFSPTPGFPIKPVNIYNLFNSSVAVSYNLDIFGGARRQIEAARADVEHQGFELEATYLTLTTNIVTTAITVASLHAQIDVTLNLIQNQEKLLRIIKNNATLGHASPSEVLSQEINLKEVQATLPSLKNQLIQEENTLSILIGALPGECELPALSLNDMQLPTELPVSLPSALVRQRPDIRSAEALLHKASAKIGVATANLFPKVNLNAAYGWTSTVLSNLFDSDNNVWGYGVQILQPIFHGGALRAKRRAAIAVYNQNAAQYRKTVLEAFKEVANVLRALEYDAQLLQVQAKSEAIAKKQLQLVKNQYHLGKTSYLIVLEIQQKYHQARLNRIQAETKRYTDTAALFESLGGGWWNRECI